MLLDLHSHTSFSHDGRQTPEENVKDALSCGIKILAFTDHADLWYWDHQGTPFRTEGSVRAAEQLASLYNDRIRVLRGIELGESNQFPKRAAAILTNNRFDVVLASLHCLAAEGWNIAFSHIDFSEQACSVHRCENFFRAYLHSLADMAAVSDYDILAHLSVPLRYINGKYKRGLDLLSFRKEIETVLDIVVKRGKTLEVNCAGDEPCPELPVLAWYKAMGGELVSIGSDAHAPGGTNRLNRLLIGQQSLKAAGFSRQCYYIDRKLHLCELN